MEFVDNSGHIFSLPSYNENPIGYEYDEQSYVFWLGYDNYERLSVNNYYVKPIYILYHIENEFDNDDINNIINNLDIDIYFNNTSIFKLLSPCQVQEKILDINTINDYINFDIDDENIVKDSLSKEDLCIILTKENINNINYNFLLIPIYVLGNTSEEGTWMSNLMIHINDNNVNIETWCPITIGGLFVDEYEELIINGKNLGVNLPKDILKAIYQESLYNDEFNSELYNRKLKEYLLNYSGIKIELGNYNSVIKSLNWFGYGDKIVISKLMKTDNDIMSQYVRDYFYTNDDILRSFSKFKNDSLISLTIMTNKELDETNGINFESYFHGEDKPKLIDLKNHNEIVEINNHDMPIENDKEKYYYWKPYFDFSIVELGLKLSCLKYYYKKYFLPIHLTIHTASLAERVFANDMKLSMIPSSGYSVPIVQTYSEYNDVEFLGNGIHYFTKQIHYIDDCFNEYSQSYIEQNNDIIFYELNDTCINIPISFLSNKVYNCILLFEKVNKYQNDLLFESHFTFYNYEEDSTYKNFIIYPKKLNIKNLIESKYFEYWINSNFKIELCVNGKWYDYEFESRISRPVLDFGTLKYKYYFNSVKDILKESINEDDYIKYKHSLLILSKDDKTVDLSQEVTYQNNDYNHEDLYNHLSIDDDLSVIIPNDTLNEEYNLMINYGNFNKFNQISNITDEKINFNAYMHEHSLVETNNIDFDINLYKILKYNLQNNLQYIDGELLNDEFYSYIEYWDELSINDERLKTFFNDKTNNVYGLQCYKLENNKHKKVFLYCVYENDEDDKYYIYNENNELIEEWLNNSEKLYLRYEIVIHKDLIGKDFYVDNLYLSNLKNTLIYSYNNEALILRENDVDSNTYEVINNENNIDDPFVLILESINFIYDSINNQYVFNIDNSELRFNIYDKLFQNIDYIYDKYSYNPNLINSDKYLNSIHLFNIYNRNYRLTNTLSLNKNTDINVNGINFKYVNKTVDTIDNDYINIKNLLNNTVYSNTIKISGHIDNDIIYADSRYPDTYGLYWDKYYKDPNTGELSLNIIKLDNDPENNYLYWDNYGLYVKRTFNEEGNLIELKNNYVNIKKYSYYPENNDSLLGIFKFKTITDFYNGNCLEYPDNFYGNLIFENIGDDSKYCWEDPTILMETGIYKYDLVFTIQCCKIDEETNEEILFNFSIDQLKRVKIQNDENDENDEYIYEYNDNYDYLIVKFFYKKVTCVKNKYYSLPDFILSEHVHGEIKNNDGYYVNENKIIFNINYNEYEYSIKWIDENNEEHIAQLMKVSNNNKYVNRWGDEIKKQNPSMYWYNIDNNDIVSLDKSLNELKRYWFKENEDSTIGDTLEEIKNSLQTYKDKLEASSDPNNPNSTYGLNLEDRLELRYRYKNYVSKYYTGVKGRFKIDWEYETELEEKDKIFNLCVCITRKDNTIEIYDKNKSEFELYGDEIEVVAYFRLNTIKNEEKHRKTGTEITPFIIKPRILVLSEENTKFEYDYTKYGNEVSITIGNNEYKYGDNTSKEIIDLYNDFFECKWKLYDLYVKDSNLEKKLLYSIYDCKDQINISKNNLYDFYLMHDNKYWYGIYISKNTCDNMKLEDILIDKSKKELKLNNDYILKYERSGKEFLINRMKYVSKEGINHFKIDDMIVAKICNNDRLPTRLNVSSKWNISPMSLGMNVSNNFESNAEMTILSLPENDNKHQSGYYKVTVRYSLDRDLQHQFKDLETIRIS